MDSNHECAFLLKSESSMHLQEKAALHDRCMNDNETSVGMRKFSINLRMVVTTGR